MSGEREESSAGRMKRLRPVCLLFIDSCACEFLCRADSAAICFHKYELAVGQGDIEKKHID